ncbi:MAG: transporter substrate-binding domain-containing protein, partial [Spirochaetes bacterium]|nr:transporter substrate-binding domain-containing protein [Spirochaetota bacterium]
MFINPMGLFDKAILVDSLPFALFLLSKGEGDFVVAPYVIGKKTIVENELNNISIVGPPILPSFYRLAVKKGNQNLLAELNEAIDKFKSTSAYINLERKWFQYRREDELSTALVLKYAFWIGIPIALIFLLMFSWSWTLRRLVIKKTSDLNQS